MKTCYTLTKHTYFVTNHDNRTDNSRFQINGDKNSAPNQSDESKLNFNKTQDQATESTRFAECSSITCGFSSTHFAGKYFSTVVETQCAMG